MTPSIHTAALVGLTLAVGASVWHGWTLTRELGAVQASLDQARVTEQDRLAALIAGQTAAQREQAGAMQALQGRLETLSRNHAAQAAQLEAILHADPDAAAWGRVRIPDAVVRLWSQPVPAAGAKSEPVPAADRVPPTGDRTHD